MRWYISLSHSGSDYNPIGTWSSQAVLHSGCSSERKRCRKRVLEEVNIEDIEANVKLMNRVLWISVSVYGGIINVFTCHENLLTILFPIVAGVCVRKIRYTVQYMLNPCQTYSTVLTFIICVAMNVRVQKCIQEGVDAICHSRC